MISFSDEELKIFSRVKQGYDGYEFLELLKKMLNITYSQILDSPKESRSELIGQAQCLNSLIKVFSMCDDKLKERMTTKGEQRL